MTMPNNFWTIDNDPPPNPGAGNALNGLQIQQVTSGTPPVVTGYQLMNGASQVGSTTDTTMPISFTAVEFASRTWDISATVTPAVDGSGTWTIVDGLRRSEEDTGDNGEFTAQAGSGAEETDAASSANA
jgi:hypothetical protein